MAMSSQIEVLISMLGALLPSGLRVLSRTFFMDDGLVLRVVHRRGFMLGHIIVFFNYPFFRGFASKTKTVALVS